MSTAPRRPYIAGAFYPSEGAALTRAIEECFLDPRGPGDLPVRHRSVERRIRGAISPHAGYPFSGAIAAHAFAAIAAERPPSSVLMLGFNHSGLGAPAALSARDWLTPLGRVPVDPDLLQALNRRPIEIDETSHAREYSIEVELPFLQYVVPFPRIAALNVTLGPIGFLADVAAIIQKAVRGRDTLLIASTDFSHYIPAEEARRRDQLALDRILARDGVGLYETALTHRLTMCGLAPTTTLLLATAEEELSGRLLRYGNSGEVEPMDEVVAYASLVLQSSAPLPPGPAVGGGTAPGTGTV